MKTSVKATAIAAAIVIVAVLAGALTLMLNKRETQTEPQPTSSTEAPVLVRADSHVLDDAGPHVPMLVEFLDFECEACGALYPEVEKIREKYDGKLTYIVRYFPLSGHKNGLNAALAAEAAAQQGQFEAMYKKLFETQAQWGEKSDSQAAVFRGFAEELGLDLAAYDAAVADPATTARVQKDFDDGLALGVTSTPTFFLNGQKVELKKITDLADAVDAFYKQ